MKHRAWLVDLDGTLYRAGRVRLMMGLQLLIWGRRDLTVVRVFRQQQEALRQCTTASADPFSEQITATAALLDLPAEQVRQIVSDWMIQRPAYWLRTFRRHGLLKKIREFRDQGGKTALVSDYPAKQKLIALCAADLFDVVIASGEPGGPQFLKPNPQGYLLAAEQLQTPPGDCLVIGDRTDTDGLAAQAAGMMFQHIK